MSIAPGYTNEEVRAFVYEYDRQPWGTRQEWLAGQGISRDRFRRWRRAVFDGDLERGLIPRAGGGMSSYEQRQVSKAQGVYERENAQLRARVEELEQMNEALGKAIGLLHHSSVEEPTQEGRGPRSS